MLCTPYYSRQIAPHPVGPFSNNLSEAWSRQPSFGTWPLQRNQLSLYNSHHFRACIWPCKLEKSQWLHWFTAQTHEAKQTVGRLGSVVHVHFVRYDSSLPYGCSQSQQKGSSESTQFLKAKLHRKVYSRLS